jgi:hypothetical protein
MTDTSGVLSTSEYYACPARYPSFSLPQLSVQVLVQVLYVRTYVRTSYPKFTRQMIIHDSFPVSAYRNFLYKYSYKYCTYVRTYVRTYVLHTQSLLVR